LAGKSKERSDEGFVDANIIFENNLTTTNLEKQLLNEINTRLISKIWLKSDILYHFGSIKEVKINL